MNDEHTMTTQDAADTNPVNKANGASKLSAPKKAAKPKVAKVSEGPSQVNKTTEEKPAKKAAEKKVETNKSETPAPKQTAPKQVVAKKTATKKAASPATVAPEDNTSSEVKTPAAEDVSVKNAAPAPLNETLTNLQPEKRKPGRPKKVEAIRPVVATPPDMKVKPAIVEPAIETVGKKKVMKQAAVSSREGLRKITFQVRFHTTLGQSLFVTGEHALLGNNDNSKALPLSYLDEEYWFGVLEIPEGEPFAEDVCYSYMLKNVDGTTAMEWGKDRTIQPSLHKVSELHLIDVWNASSAIENTFYTEPFQQVLFKEDFTEVPVHEEENATHVFRIKMPVLPKGYALCIAGSVPELGGWNSKQPLLLSRKQGDMWHTISFNFSDATFPISYKYGIYNIDEQKLETFENGNNRALFDACKSETLTVVSDGFINFPYKAFKGAGVAIPVFSLRSNNSFGVGEFADLKLLIDWTKQVGLKLIQLLPINDTTATHSYTDSYPYAAVSAFALHPLYLHLPALVNKENQHFLNDLKSLQEELNNKDAVDYTAVMAAKWELIKQIFPSQKEATFKSNDFHTFFTNNAHWLVPYAAFSYLREKYKTSEFSKWETNATYNEDEINAITASPLRADDAISVYYYVQYHLHLQLKDATNYAHANGIIVKGDIPIGIYRNSCDAWQQPELYNMDMQAGAPPDDFAVKGQNWGFPTYNWQRMREDGFNWWKRRFKQMSYYFDAFRIDHILGFFRIWSIPLHAVEGIMGHFVPAVPVHVNEFLSRGILFDKDRYCQPYINDVVLEETFGWDADEVKEKFLEGQYGYYKLKEAFNTQRMVETYFATQQDIPENNSIKQGLFDLISNVILFEEGTEGQHFHFRIGMHNTSCYKHLDAHTQNVLNELYISYFYRRQDPLWYKEAMLKLPVLKRSTDMLICGEDLGMVPETVPVVMKELAMLSLEIQRMPKDPKREFFHPNDAPYLSVVTPSTHDMSTIRGWWEEDRGATQRFFNHELGQWGTAPYYCEPWLCKIILQQHFYSPAMWSIFQLQDLFSINDDMRRDDPNEERINIPADPKHYWRFRMHITLEDLVEADEFNKELSGYILQSGR